MQEIIQSFFKERSLVNHQIASYDDCIPAGDNMISRMEKIIRNIRVGIDGEVDDDDGGFIKLDVVDQDIVIRMKNIQLGEPTIREANGSEHPSTPMECRLRKLTYMSPVTIDFQIVRNGIPSPKEEGVQVGSMLHASSLQSPRCDACSLMFVLLRHCPSTITRLGTEARKRLHKVFLEHLRLPISTSGDARMLATQASCTLPSLFLPASAICS